MKKRKPSAALLRAATRDRDKPIRIDPNRGHGKPTYRDRLLATIRDQQAEIATLRKRLDQTTLYGKPTANAKPTDELIVVNGAYQFDLRHAHANPLARKLFHLANDIFRATTNQDATDDAFQPHVERLRSAAMSYVTSIEDIRQRIQR